MELIIHTKMLQRLNETGDVSNPNVGLKEFEFDSKGIFSC